MIEREEEDVSNKSQYTNKLQLSTSSDLALAESNDIMHRIERSFHSMHENSDKETTETTIFTVKRKEDLLIDNQSSINRLQLTTFSDIVKSSKALDFSSKQPLESFWMFERTENHVWPSPFLLGVVSTKDETQRSGMNSVSKENHVSSLASAKPILKDNHVNSVIKSLAREVMEARTALIHFLNWDDIRRACCSYLKDVPDDAFEVWKAIAPVLVPLSLTGSLSIPLQPMLWSVIGVVIAKAGIGKICKDIQNTKPSLQG
ncbi:hypothetical protein Lepto7375DRAFT_0702 [Leptolyngbya sp. PCC 7375]|nr:hypothetical protein Lepto7375DRAFT_0702 [Leptolyngbya sp. PCC 7375]